MRSRQPRGEFADIAAVSVFDDGFQNPAGDHSAPDRFTDLRRCRNLFVNRRAGRVERGFKIVDRVLQFLLKGRGQTELDKLRLIFRRIFLKSATDG